MLVGTADLDQLAQTAATIDTFPIEALRLEDVVCLQLTAEMHNQAREAVLPSSLHPTVPAILSIQVWQVGASPWDAFALAFARVACRSGVRARGFRNGDGGARRLGFLSTGNPPVPPVDDHQRGTAR